MAKDCIWQNAPNVNSMEKVKEKGAIGVVDEWTTVRKGKGILAENVNHSNKWVPIRNRIGSIENRTPTLPMDDVLVEEVDGASITKHKIDMDQIIDLCRGSCGSYGEVTGTKVKGSWLYILIRLKQRC